MEPEGYDEYIGWFQLTPEELFRYTWAIDVDYFFTLDSALMVASKGGLGLNMLNSIGARTKKRYMDSLQSVLKAMYGGSEEKSSGTEIDNLE